jgi:hypothetical protein
MNEKLKKTGILISSVSFFLEKIIKVFFIIINTFVLDQNFEKYCFKNVSQKSVIENAALQ